MTAADQTAAGTTLQSAAAVKLYADIARCQSPDQLDATCKLVWGAHGAHQISEEDATFLAACIQARRPLSHPKAKGTFGVLGRLSRFLPRRPQRSPDRKASRDRRRMLGGSSALPDNLRPHFTEGERAALCVIAGEIKRHGICDLPIDKIAAIAGVCRSTAQNAIREARRLGLLKVTERPQRGRKNLPNIVEVVSREWLAWIKRGPSATGRIGFKSLKMMNPTRSTDQERKRLGDESSPPKGHGPPMRGVA